MESLQQRGLVQRGDVEYVVVDGDRTVRYWGLSVHECSEWALYFLTSFEILRHVVGSDTYETIKD